MNDEQIEALLSAASAGVAFDDLRVSRDSAGYAFSVPGVDREGLPEAQFRELARENPWYVSNWHYWTSEVGRPAADSAADATAPADVESGSGDDPEASAGRATSTESTASSDTAASSDSAATDAADAAVADVAVAGRAGGGTGRESHRYAFLRWLERAEQLSVPERYEALAEDLTRRWGQLLITARVGTDGQRRYDLRHEDDEAADTVDLEAYADPRDLRELVKFDSKGRYRPLKTAPSLRAGWTVTELDGAELVQAVDTVYPATIANWHLERRDALDVSHWTETAERQTGIYDVIEQLPAEAVEWVAESCCVDSQCLKRRMWDLDADDELDVPRGDGEFPCREPCSLVVAAARKWTKLEEESTRTYEFELTPSEKEQLESIVDAVADGRIDEIREADVYEGANRYRARYLRAKRFDDDGRLSGTPTDPE